MSKHFNLFEIFKNEGKLVSITIYPYYQNENDPYEHTVTESNLNPITIKGIITEIKFETLKWKYFGQMKYGAIQLICESRYETLIKKSAKITINGDTYCVYKDAERGFSILKRADYLICILDKTQ